MKILVMGIFLLFGTTVVFAAGGEDPMVTRARYDAEMNKAAAEMNKACGTAVEAKINWDSFSGSEWERYSVSSFCGAPLTTLADFCGAENANSKAYIKKNVRSVTCSYGGEGKRGLHVDNGSIENLVDFTSSNLDKYVRAVLIKDL